MSDNITSDTTEQLVERVRCDYDEEETIDIMLDIDEVLIQIKKKHRKGMQKIELNQEIIATEVCYRLEDRKILNIMVLCKTQGGKTGSMIAVIKRYLQDKSNPIPIENIYIITGLSSTEWKDQTKERFPKAMEERIFHRCELPTTFVDEIKSKKNILIIMDEVQVAAQKGQTIYKTFEKADLLDKSTLYRNDVKILEYTASPDGTIYDLMKWGIASSKILAACGDKYTSSYNLLQQRRVKQFKDLCGYNEITKEIDPQVYENIKEIKNDIDKYERPLYHPIRTKCGIEGKITIQNFKEIFKNDDPKNPKYKFETYDKESQINDINTLLKKNPKIHTFIFIKEKLRCAKTLHKKHIGILYERYTKNPDDTTIIQGLVGRDTGYDNNGISITYTNIDTIERYEKLWNSGFEDTTIPWNSKTTRYKNGNTIGRNTFNEIKNNDDFSDTSSENHELDEPIIKKLKTQEEAKEHYKEKLKPIFGGRGPIKRKPDENGFYLSTIGKGQNRTRVRSTKEIYEVRKWCLNETHHYTFYPCYRDTQDITTLEWWLIYRKNLFVN
tara:strand:- start:11953 stop:13617 length:1665 start_codon:yes stop_codon:yes gene_type:complete